MKPNSTRAYMRNTITTFLVLVAFLATLISAVPANAATPLLDVAYSLGGNIWTQRSDGTKTQLTFTGDQWDTKLDVSPDGLNIVFSRLQPNETNATLWMMGTDGSALHQVSAVGSPLIYPSYLHDSAPRWSPDGKRISFEREVTLQSDSVTLISATSDIYTLDVATGTETSVTSAHHWAIGPAAWSPDGTRLVYWGNDIDKLKIISTDGSGDHMVSQQSPITPTDPVWSGDGNTIYFNTGDSIFGILEYTSTDHFTSALDTPAKNLTTSFDAYPRFGPDGKSLWFLRLLNRGDLTGISLVDGSLLTQPITGIDAFSFIPAKSPSPSTDLTLNLTPSKDIAYTNATHTLTANLTRNGVPIAGSLITFAVTSGPCKGKTATSTTDGTGGGAWGYACIMEGVDTVTATASVSSTTGIATSAPATATVTWIAPDTYVALGDSYSSGEGAPGPGGYVDGTNSSTNKCHRSDQAYSYLDATVQGMPPIAQFHACSGAIIEDFFTPFPENHQDSNGPQNPGETHAQLDWIGPRTKVITLTVGGNNARFPDVMAYCAQRLVSCEHTFKDSVDSAIANLSTSSNGRVSDNLPDLYAAIRLKAPSARVYVLGYPHFFPAKPKGPCRLGSKYKSFSVSDMNWINSETTKLDDHIKAAVQAAGSGFVYVPIDNAFLGHELCTPSPFMNGLMFLDLQESFHPTVDGQAKFADILSLYLQGRHL